MRMISSHSNSRGFEHYEAMMGGDADLMASSGKTSSVTSFDMEAPLDARPFIEDDHRQSAPSEE